MSPARRLPSLLRLLASVALAAPLCVAAAPDEIRVMTDDLTDAGDTAIELHLASVHARSDAATTPRHHLQGLVELARGVSDRLELSVQVPVYRRPDGWNAGGVNVEAQYIAPHQRDAGAYWGGRAEIGRSRTVFETDRTTSLELRPIVGYRWFDWHAVLNVAVLVPLSDGDGHIVVEPSAKLSRRIAPRTSLGLEYHEQAADRSEPASPLPRRKLALLVLDTKLRGVDVSIGAGRGVGRAGDGPVLNVVTSFEL